MKDKSKKKQHLTCALNINYGETKQSTPLRKKLTKISAVDMFSFRSFPTQEVKTFQKVFAISIDLSTFRSFSVTSRGGLIWFDVLRLRKYFHKSIDIANTF
jgi:hypothetical protein